MPASKKIPLTVRRTRLAKVRAKAIEKVKDKIRPVFMRQFRRLESFLRARNRGGNLRNRIGKMETLINEAGIEMNFNVNKSAILQNGKWVSFDLFTVQEFFKANAQSQQDWDAWKKTLVAALTKGDW